MKPPVVSRAQLQKSLDGASVKELNAEYARVLHGLLPNALPQFYLALRDGSLLVMQDKSKHPDGATGPQVCLATISPETLALLLASKSPVELKP